MVNSSAHGGSSKHKSEILVLSDSDDDLPVESHAAKIRRLESELHAARRDQIKAERGIKEEGGTGRKVKNEVIVVE